MNKSTIIRRILAWIIDWNLSCLPCFLYYLAIRDDIEHLMTQNPAYPLIFIFLVLLVPVTFVFRDVIFKGRSVAKSVFGLHIIDKGTNGPASVQQRIVRNLFFPIYFIDGIILIATKESVGDKVTNSTVVGK